MTARRRLLLSATLALLLLPVIAYVAANAWLESSGGRQALERALSDLIGMPVELRGEFDIMLLPRIGVSGTELVIGGSRAGEAFVSNTNYQLAIALRPLFEKHVLIESVWLEGGVVDPERYSRSATEKTQAVAGKAWSPEIEHFVLQNFQLNLPGDSAGQILISDLTFSEFAADKPTPFSMDIEALGRLAGEISWSGGKNTVTLKMDWSGHALGSARLSAELLLPEKSGAVEVQYLPNPDRDTLILETVFKYLPEAVLFPEIRFAVAGQSISGDGCLLQGKPAALNLVLETAALDLDALREMLPESIGSGEGESSMPLELNIHLSAGELKAAGAVARGAILQVGEQPACDF